MALELSTGRKRAALALAATAWGIVASATSAAPDHTAMGGRAGWADYRHVSTWRSEQALGPAVQPLDIAVGAGERLYVADGLSNRILVYDRAPEPVGAWAAAPHQRGQQLAPMALALDPHTDQLHAAWRDERIVVRQGGETIGAGTRIDSYGPGGAQQEITPMDGVIGAAPDDMEFHAPSGDLFVSAGGQIARVDLMRRLLSRFHLPGGDEDSGHFAVTSDERFAVAKQQAGKVVILKAGRAWSGTLELGQNVPLDVTADDADNIHVLVRPRDAPNPSAPLIMTFEVTGRLVRSLTAADLGAPHPAAVDWPWALHVGPGGLAFTTGTQQFEIHRRDATGGALPVILGGPVPSAYTPTVATDVSDDWVALAPTSDGGLLVVDNQWQQLVAIDTAGAMRQTRRIPSGTVDVVAGDDGAVYISARSDRLLRLPPGPADPPAWDVACNCKLGGRLAFGGGVLHVTRPLVRSVAAHDPSTGRLVQQVHRADAAGWWPRDVVMSPDGRLITADQVSRQVHVWRRTGELDAVWQFGLLAGPRHLAAGRLGDGSAVIAAVMADGFVELHDAADGRLLLRWKPVLTDGSAVHAADIALGPNGRVFLAQSSLWPNGWAVHVFDPVDASVPTTTAVPGSTPTPSPAVSPSPTMPEPPMPTRSDLSCTVRGDKLAAPSRIRLGETARVTLTLSADCPSRVPTGADIALVVDVSGSMNGQKLASAKAAAQSVVELIDFRYHRVGLVSFSTDASVVVPLTDDIAALVAGLEGLVAFGGTNITAAVARADALLQAEARIGALPVIVLLSDGRHNDSAATRPPRAVAADVRDRGVRIYAIGLGQDADADLLSDIAGDPARYFYAPAPADLFPIYEQIILEVLNVLAGNLIIDDEMGAEVDIVPGSVSPPALELPDRLRWGSSVFPAGGITLTYAIRPRATGLLPTNRRAAAAYTDGDGAQREFVFPVPVIEVIGPTPTPSPWPPPTATRVPQVLFLPVALREECIAEQRRTDVALVLDASTSMLEPAASGTKLDAARDAVRAFLDQLQLATGDQAAIISFDGDAEVLQALTADRASLDRALAMIRTGHQTRIHRGIEEAHAELTSARRHEANVAVMIVLTDGRANPEGPEFAFQRAEAARADGITIFTVGLGQELDFDILERMASRPEYFFRSPGAEDLTAIYARIAVNIPCPADAFWGGRP